MVAIQRAQNKLCGLLEKISHQLEAQQQLGSECNDAKDQYAILESPSFSIPTKDPRNTTHSRDEYSHFRGNLEANLLTLLVIGDGLHLGYLLLIAQGSSHGVPLSIVVDTKGLSLPTQLGVGERIPLSDPHTSLNVPEVTKEISTNVPQIGEVPFRVQVK